MTTQKKLERIPSALASAMDRASRVSDGGAGVYVASVLPRQAMALIKAGARPIHEGDAERLRAALAAGSKERRLLYFEPTAELRDAITKLKKQRDTAHRSHNERN